MRKRSLVVGTMTALFCAGMFFMNPDSACAAQGTEAYRAVFDARYYHDAYPDVAEAFGNDSSALFNHFVTYGAKEGRSASAEFNPQAYRARYGDLQKAFGNDMAAYCNHYISFGRAEGRSGAADGSIYSAPKETAAAGTSSAEKTGADTNGTSQTQSVQGTVIGSCTTKYETRIPRAKNVDLAAARINGIVVQPGESFSFSAAILPRPAPPTARTPRVSYFPPRRPSAPPRRQTGMWKRRFILTGPSEPVSEAACVRYLPRSMRR